MKCFIAMEAVRTILILLQLLLSADCLAISPRWSHLRWKTVPPARVDVRASGEVLLSCSATGSPAPALAWYKDGLFTPHLELEELDAGASLGETVARLRLPCLTELQAGTYECRARAGRQELSVVTEVRVVDWQQGDLCSEAGSPEVGVWSPTLMVEEGRTAVLRCRAMQGGLEDKVETVWTNEDGEVLGKEMLAAEEEEEDDSEKKVKKTVKHRLTATGDLVVEEVSFADMGTYTCSLKNLMGSDSASTFLYPLAPSP